MVTALPFAFGHVLHRSNDLEPVNWLSAPLLSYGPNINRIDFGISYADVRDVRLMESNGIVESTTCVSRLASRYQSIATDASEQ